MDKALEIELAEIRPKVLALALKFFRSSHLYGDPEDVVQDVLLRLWMARSDGARIRSVEAWAVTTTKNSCISLWRKKDREGARHSLNGFRMTRMLPHHWNYLRLSGSRKAL